MTIFLAFDFVMLFLSFESFETQSGVLNKWLLKVCDESFLLYDFSLVAAKFAWPIVAPYTE